MISYQEASNILATRAAGHFRSGQKYDLNGALLAIAAAGFAIAASTENPGMGMGGGPPPQVDPLGG